MALQFNHIVPVLLPSYLLTYINLHITYGSGSIQKKTASPISQGELDYTMVLTMVQKLSAQLGDMYTDKDKIRSVCDGLLRDYRLRDEAIENLTPLVKKGADCTTPQRPHIWQFHTLWFHRISLMPTEIFGQQIFV